MSDETIGSISPPADIEPPMIELPQAPTEPAPDRRAGQVHLLFAICLCLTARERPPAGGADRRVGQVYFLLAVSLGLMVFVNGSLQLFDFCVILAGTEAALIVPTLVYLRTKRLPLAGSLGWRRVPLKTALVGGILGVTGFGVAQAIAELQAPIIGEGPDMDFLRADSPQRLAALIFCGALLPGLCEETVFRGLVQGTLSRFGPTRAIAITSILFAFFHLNPWTFVPIFFVSVMQGMIAWRSGSVVPSIVAHVMLNATALTFAYLEDDEHGFQAKMVFAVGTILFGLFFTAYLRRTAGRPVEPSPLATMPAALSWRFVGITLAAVVVLFVIVWTIVIVGMWIDYVVGF